MDQTDIYPPLTEIIREVLDDPDFQVGPETTANDHADWNSFNHINIIVAVEVRFAIKLKTAEIESIRNVGDLVSLIARKRKAA